MNDIVGTAPTSDDRNMAMLAHLLGIFFGFVPALVIWLIKKDSSPFVAQEAKEALNFQITMLIGFFIAGLSMMILIGLLLVPALGIVDLVFCILAAVATSKGQPYRYPFAIRLIN
jgi:uncharacterized Tic20 family protein